MNVTPDPLWPAGVPAEHLKGSVAETFNKCVGEVWKCEKCGSLIKQSSSDARYCTLCVDRESRNSNLAKKINSSWMEQATEIGLALFERQPEETEEEWRIWCVYRSYYPRKMPTWKELAEACECSVVKVTTAANKWSYKVRLISWARYTDDSIQEKRIVAIKEMNDKQLLMAQTIQNKLAVAIGALDPMALRPGEIVNLFKVATELERRVTTYVDERVDSVLVDSRSKQVSTTKPEDLGTIVSILQNAGVLDGKIIGVEQTTRLIAKESD